MTRQQHAKLLKKRTKRKIKRKALRLAEEAASLAMRKHQMQRFLQQNAAMKRFRAAVLKKQQMEANKVGIPA